MSGARALFGRSTAARGSTGSAGRSLGRCLRSRFLRVQRFLPCCVQVGDLAGLIAQCHRAVLDVQNRHPVHIQCSGIDAVKGHLLGGCRRLERFELRLFDSDIPHAVSGIKTKNEGGIIAGSRTVVRLAGNSDPLAGRLRRCLRIRHRLECAGVRCRKSCRAAQQTHAQSKSRRQNTKTLFHKVHPPVCR